MKRAMSVILALVLTFSLASVMSVTALAEGDGLAIVVTGGTGDAIGGEGLGFASAAALRNTYDEEAVLLVDAGGFAASAPAILTAAGYDLIVPDEALTDWDVTSISMGVSGLSAGVMFDKNGVRVAFVGVVPMGGQEADTYYGNIQAAVTAARDKGAAYVVALGLVDDADALTANVSGIDALLTYGEAGVEGLAAAEEAPAEDGESEETAEPAAVILTVGERFGTIGVLTLDGDGVFAENIDAEQYAEKGLEESDVIRTLEASVVKTAPVEEIAEDTVEEPAEETEEESVEETAEETVEEPVEEPAEETAEEPVEEPAEDTTEEEPALQGEAEAQTEEVAPVEPTPVADTASAADAAETEETPEPEATPETVAWDGEPEGDSPTDYAKGPDDLKLEFEHPVSMIRVPGEGGVLKEFLPEYYTASEDGKTVSIKASVLNGWPEATYGFTFSFSDGAEDKEVLVSVSGTYTAPTATPEPTAEPTATPAPTAEPTATPAPTSTNAQSNPATGDNSPILLYVILLVVLVAALAVVVVLVVRKNKRNSEARR